MIRLLCLCRTLIVSYSDIIVFHAGDRGTPGLSGTKGDQGERGPRGPAGVSQNNLTVYIMHKINNNTLHITAAIRFVKCRLD